MEADRATRLHDMADIMAPWFANAAWGYQIREAGSTAARKLAFTLADGIPASVRPWRLLDDKGLCSVKSRAGDAIR